jgi:hypothetical protein
VTVNLAAVFTYTLVPAGWVAITGWAELRTAVAKSAVNTVDVTRLVLTFIFFMLLGGFV